MSLRSHLAKAVRIFVPFFYLVLAVVGHAQVAADLTPGSVEPQRAPEILPDIEREEIFTVPMPAERDASRVGPSINVADFVIVYDAPEQIADSAKLEVSEILAGLIKENKGVFDFALLEDAPRSVTNYLRSAGYMLARAILPPQEVEGNSVRLNVYVGTLGKAYAVDNTLYSERQIISPFVSKADRVIRLAEVESSLLRIRDLPGLEAIAKFEPGSEVGTADVGLQVTEEKRLGYRFRVDNHGVEPTGKIRALAGVSINNPLGLRDQFSIDAVKTFDSGDLKNMQLRYQLTDPSLYHTIGVAFSETQYQVETGPAKIFDIRGDTEIADLFLYSQWLRSRSANFATSLGFATKRAESDSNIDGLLDGVDRLSVASMTLIADGIDSRFRGIHRATLSYYRGFNDFVGSMDNRGNRNSLGEIPGTNGPLDELPGKFEKVSATYNRLQSISQNHSVLLRLAGQYSNDRLSSLEKMSLGGPYTVRAYPVAEYVAERATFASLSWVINGAFFGDPQVYRDYQLGDVFSMSLFADYGWGKNRNPDGSVSRREIDGVGVQFDFSIPDQGAYLELIAAQTLGGDEAINGDEFQFWFNVGVEL